MIPPREAWFESRPLLCPDAFLISILNLCFMLCRPSVWSSLPRRVTTLVSCVDPILLGMLLGRRPRVQALGCLEHPNTQVNLQLILCTSESAVVRLLLALFENLVTRLAAMV